MLALLAGSFYVIATKPTKLGLDLSGGTQLVYQARAERAEPGDRPRGHRPGRSRSSATASTRSASPSRRSPRSARTRSRSACPTSRTRSARSSRSATRPALLLRPRAERRPAAGRVEPARSPRQPRAQSTTSQYDAVELASEQEPQSARRRPLLLDRAEPTTSSRSSSRQYVAGPEETERDLLSLPQSQEVPEGNRKIFEVPEGTIVVEDQPQTDTEGNAVDGAPDRYFVLKDNPSLSGDDIEDPEQNFDPNNQPNVTFDFTDDGREAFQEITRDIAQRGVRSPALGRSRTALRDRARRRDRLAADHRLRGEPRRDRRPQRRPDLGQLQRPGGAGPRRVPEDRRAAGRPEADQPEHGHGDARPAGARPGPQGGPRGPDPRRRSSCSSTTASSA